MKYVMLTYASEDDWTNGDGRGDRIAARSASATALADELIASGELVYAVGLGDPTHTQTLEIRDGVPILTDGTQTSTKEILAGIGIVEVASHDRALEVAARTATVVGRVEMRPLDDALDAKTECELR